MTTEPDRSSADTLRLGLFGGTFDPPHVGHVRVAADVADALELDRVLWIPAADPPHKESGSVSDAMDRLAMVRAATRADPRFEVSEIELDRGGTSFSVDTVHALRERYPDAEIFLIVGADEFAIFDSWRQPERILDQVRLAVMDRDGARAASRMPSVAGAEEARFVPVTRVDISSTQVRERVRTDRDVSGLVPAGVREIIEDRGLYRA